VSLTKTANPENQFAAVQQYLEHYENEYKEKLRSSAFDSYSCFAEYLNMDEPPAPHHHFMCEKLQLVECGDIPRLALSVPAGGGKSEYSSRRFAVWCMGRRKTKWLQASYAAAFATNELGKKTKAYVNGDAFKDVFGDVALQADMRAGDRWALTNKSEYVAKGVGAGIMGIRANIGCIDDLYASYLEAQNPKVRDDAYSWFLSDFQTRLLPRAPIVLVNTRYNSDDMIGRLETEGKKGNIIPYEIINLKALSELGDEDDPMGRTEPDMPLWDFYHQDYLNKRATLTGAMWGSMMQGVPVDAEGVLLKSSWFNRYKGDVRKNPEIKIRRIVMSVDTAQKAQERHDYTVCTVWLETEFGLHYLLDCVRDKVEFPEMCKLIDETAQRWNVSCILIEDKGSGTQYIQTRQGKTSVPIIAISTNNNSKEFRFDAVAPTIEAGLVYLPESANWLAEYERELMAFPYGKNDDMVDSTSQYLEWARGRQRKLGTKKLHGSGSTPSSDAKRTMVEKAIQEEMERKRIEREKREQAAAAAESPASTQPDGERIGT
jgi:predicted phage terminase large subunit-like protein